MTGDPEGDVWYRSRSTLIGAVSNVTFQTFINSFNTVVMQASNSSNDTFYTDRGLEVASIELTGFSCVEAQTAAVLRQIIQESTNRLKNKERQAGEHDVNQAKLTADIQLEKQRENLIRTQTMNEKLAAQMNGTNAGLEQANEVSAFMTNLNNTLSNITSRYELYKMHQQMQSTERDTASLSTGNASLFITPQDMNLKLMMPHPQEL